MSLTEVLVDGNYKLSEPIQTLCMACCDEKCDFKPMMLQRRSCGDEDIVIDMKYCGVCHSDLHVAANHLGGVMPVTYPCVPGHELAGVVIEVGSKVTKFKVGDHAGVGCMVDSCGTCAGCKAGEEQKCRKQVGTYNGKNLNGRAETFPVGGQTLGGYTQKMVVHENFGINLPKTYPLEMAGPIMCAGITMYDPMMKAGVKVGSKVGIVGLGGLGVMGVKIANALGCIVTVITRSSSKEALARRSGATNFIISTSDQQMKESIGIFDLIINTVPSYHDYNIYTKLLNKTGKQVLLGLHKGLVASMIVSGITCGASKVMGSAIGGIKATQDIINLCDKYKIYPEVEIVPCHDINKVYGLLDSNNESGVRYVLDIQNTLNDDTLAKCVDPAPKLKAAESGLNLCTILGECFGLFFCCRWR